MIMSKKVINLPPGFRFKPRDDELINDYLKPRIMGQKLPCNIINDNVQVYAPDSTPWLLFDLGDPDSWIDSTTNSEKTLYVFTSLSKIATDSNKTTSRTRCNTNKRAGCGAWVQRTKRLPIIDRDNNVIGGKRMLNFVIHDIEPQFDLDKAVYFKMHEYSLWGINDNLDSDLVLCEITFDPCKKSFCKLTTKTTDQVSRRGRKPQNRKQNNKILEESRTLTSVSVPVMSSSNVYQESTSSNPESLVAIDVRVGNDDCYATAPYDNTSSNPEIFVAKDARAGNDDCYATAPYDNTSSNPESLVAIDVRVGNDDCYATAPYDSTSSNPESLVAIDARVGNDDCYATAPYGTGVQGFDDFAGGLCFDGPGGEGLCFDGQGGEGICFDDLGGESFDIAGFVESMMSIPEVEPLEDGTIHGHGKRKSAEWDNPCLAKKMCF